VVMSAIAARDRGPIGMWTLVISSVGAAETVAVTQEGVDGEMTYPGELRSLWLGPECGDRCERQPRSATVYSASDASRRRHLCGTEREGARIQMRPGRALCRGLRGSAMLAITTRHSSHPAVQPGPRMNSPVFLLHCPWIGVQEGQGSTAGVQTNTLRRPVSLR
jgi:hypothetical protein